jgi:hypothetical protein
MLKQHVIVHNPKAVWQPVILTSQSMNATSPSNNTLKKGMSLTQRNNTHLKLAQKTTSFTQPASIQSS